MRPPAKSVALEQADPARAGLSGWRISQSSEVNPGGQELLSKPAQQQKPGLELRRLPCVMERAIDASARAPGHTAALGTLLTPAAAKGSSAQAPAAPEQGWAVQGGSPPGCSPGSPPDARLQSGLWAAGESKAADPTTRCASALALEPASLLLLLRTWMLQPATLSPLLLSAASAQDLPTPSLQTGRCGLWARTSTGMQVGPTPDVG